MKSLNVSLLFALVGVFALMGCQPAAEDSAQEEADAGDASAEAQTPVEEEETMTEAAPITEFALTMKTSKGDIHLTLYADKTPVTVANFLNLVQRGYYDGLKFHRVIPDFMVQGGCPLGTGTGGPGYQFGDEFHPDLKHDRPGILSMANSGPGTNGSQFFITHVPTGWLDGKHSVFGSVVAPEDQEVVNSIAGGDTISTIEIEGDTAALFASVQSDIDSWNAALDK